MAVSTAPDAPANPRTRWYVIGGIALAILLIVLYSFYKARRDEAILADIQSKNTATQAAAAQTLLEKDRFVDLILAQPPDTRDAAIVAVEEYANKGDDAAKKEAIDALLGLSKGVDREINDPDKAVRDREGAVRKNAWMAIGRIGDVGTEQLLAALKDPSGNVRAAAIEGLGVIGQPAIPGLMEMMKERDTWGPAGDALTKIGQPALEPVRPLIDTPGDKKMNRELRLKMAGMLGAFNNQVVVPDLLRHIDDTDPGMRRQVIRTLAGLQDQRATMDVIRVMKEDPQVRLDAITALGEFRDPRAINPLADQFDSYDYDVPTAAVAALSKIGPASLPRLLNDAKSQNPQIRRYAVSGLATIGGPATVQPLLVAAKDPDPTVRAEAISGMGKFTGEDATRAVPLLVGSFRDPDAVVSNEAVVTLIEIGTNPANEAVSAQVVQPVLALFNQGNKPQDVYNKDVFYAERVLSSIGKPAIPHLVAAVKNGSPSTQKWAALTLGDMKTDRDVAVKQGVDELRALARSSDPEVSWAAKDALNRLGASA